jgi:tryptophanyl-tRNA synthetase
MAADILIHRAAKVPVGKDQEQNMEMARRYARRFNTIYGVDYFAEPQSFYFSEKAVKIPGLDGSGKMGKSEGNCIYLKDEPSVIRKKVMRAVTDNGPQAPNSPKPEVIENLFTFLNVVSDKETYDYFNEKWNDCSIRYGDLKKKIAEDIITFNTPIREKMAEFESNQPLLDKIIEEGDAKAREHAAKTIKEVREIIGFRPY